MKDHFSIKNKVQAKGMSMRLTEHYGVKVYEDAENISTRSLSALNAVECQLHFTFVVPRGKEHVAPIRI